MIAKTSSLSAALYRISCTPQTISEETSVAVHKLAGLAAKKNIGHPYMNNFIFFANLLGVGADLTGFGLIKHQLHLLVEQCCDAAKFGQTSKRELFDSLEILRSLMSDEELRKEIMLLKLERENKSTTPIFAFHIAGAAKGDSLKTNYENFALDINKRLRRIERQVPQRLEEAARIMRFFVNSPYIAKGYLGVEVIKSGLRGIAALKRWGPDTLEQYEDFVDKMFGFLEPPKPRGGGYIRTTYTRYVHFDDIYVTEDGTDEKRRGGYGLRINRKYSLPRVAAREGEGIDDYPEEENSLPVPSPFISRRAHSELPLSVLTYLPHTFFWDRRSLKLYEMSLLFYFLFDEYDCSADFVVLKAFLENALFLGLGLDDLIDIIIGRAHTSSEAMSNKRQDNAEIQKRSQLFLSSACDTISYTIPESALGYNKDMCVSRNCLVSVTVVTVKLPRSMGETFNDIIVAFKDQRRGSSSTFLFPGEIRAKCYSTVKRFIVSFNERFELNISKEKVTGSFKPFFQARYGCDPICVSYISAALDAGTRTQRFYSLIEPQVLHDEYYRGHHAFKKDIHKNLIEISRVEESVVPVRSLDYLAIIDKKPGYDELKEFSAIGSKVVPDMMALKNFFGRIMKILESFPLPSIQDRCDYHDLYTVFAYVVVQLGSALRPIADPPIDLHSIDFIDDSLYIADKDTKKFKECRIVRCPTVVIEILKQLAHGARHTMGMLRSMNSKNDKLDNRLFYFIAGDRQSVDVTPEHIRAIIGKHGLTELYDYPLNCMRHLIRTILPRRGVCSDLVDATMGHQRNGRALLDLHSTSSAESLRLASKIVGDLMYELEIRSMRYAA